MRRLLPVLFLLILSPLVSEWLLGSSPISDIYILPIMGGAYGAGAIFIREIAVRRGLKWPRIALLAVAFAMLLEGLVFQTCFNPHFVGYLDVYGRWLGVNWYWSEFIIGWHAIWTVCVPILLTELLFPAYQGRPWLKGAGFVVIGILCLLCCLLNALIYYYFLTQHFIAAPILLACTALLIVALALLALLLPVRSTALEISANDGTGASLWLVGIVVCLACIYWLGIHEFITPTFPVPALVLIIAGLALVAAMALLLNRWALQNNWQRDAYLRTLATAALLAGGLVGIRIVQDGKMVDQLGQAALLMIAVILLAVWNWKLASHKAIARKETIILDKR